MISSSLCPHGGEIVIDDEGGDVGEFITDEIGVDEIDAKIDDTEFDLGRCGPTDPPGQRPVLRHLAYVVLVLVLDAIAEKAARILLRKFVLVEGLPWHEN